MMDLFIFDEPTDVSVESVPSDTTIFLPVEGVTILSIPTDIYVVIRND